MSVAILDAMAYTEIGLPSGFAVSDGSDRIAFVALGGYHFADAVAPTSMTLGGQTMELVGTVESAESSNYALAIFALRESGIAAMSGNEIVASGDTFSAPSSVYWSVSGADQSADFTAETQVDSLDSVALSLVRAADSMTFVVEVLGTNSPESVTWADPDLINAVAPQGAFVLSWGGETDTERTANWTSSGGAASLGGAVLFNVLPVSAGGGSSSILKQMMQHYYG